ncbi:MAG: amidophosphoribosyltransferase [Planctomycetes bacterium]|nr:amidophosphoribosyltransferase [Planctomycetota bacterium]NOG53974.1 amidophosphoribosyltransferase [Planctomycetota bacterium]
MSDSIGHECGLALIRLRKPLSYYREKYETPTWGLDRLHLLMIKQRNRGQDGAGAACVKLDVPMGSPYLLRKRSSLAGDPGQAVFDEIYREMAASADADGRPGDPELVTDALTSMSDDELKARFDFLGELYLGHLRYSTHGEDDSLSACHPHVRHSNWASRSLAIAGNFNLTNADELFAKLVGYGLRPVGVADTLTLLEKIGHFLDGENDRILKDLFAQDPTLSGADLARELATRVDLVSVFENAAKDWDGGYMIAGLVGHGDAFVCRDPSGIRPGFYYENDEVIAMASERAALCTVFNVEPSDVKVVKPGHLFWLRHDGSIVHEPFTKPLKPMHCSFERIYFSRGNDPDIYRERKALGRELAEPTLKAIDHDIEHTVFSFIPNTAETAFLGLVEEVGRSSRQHHADELWQLYEAGSLTRHDVNRLMLNGVPRVEKAAHKDQKMRTFIMQERLRGDLVSHVYDITRHCLNADDTLVVLDDSIVRGTTLRESIVTMLIRLNPKRIIILSSAPPIKYPDCYGIDMSELGRFVAFQAAIKIVKERGDEDLIKQVYEDCCALAATPRADRPQQNLVKRLYDEISEQQLGQAVAELVRPRDVPWDGEFDVIYQSIDGLRQAIPKHHGDWYFTGDYPTPGGYRVVNRAFINYYENKCGRSYG